jgi:iron-sulfur cluster assembly protein
MITLTDPAYDKIKKLIQTKSAAGVQIGVKTTGCSGLAYTLEYLREDKFDPMAEILVYPFFVIKIYTRDLVYLRGMTVDYVRQGLNEGFEFRNPNERDRCGCGESFRV